MMTNQNEMIWEFGQTPLDRFLRWLKPMWNDTLLPLFKQKAGKFIQTIKFADQIPRKGLTMCDADWRGEDLLVNNRKKEVPDDCYHNPPCSPAQRAINHPEIDESDDEEL